VVAVLHSAEVEARGEVECVVLHGLGEGVAGGEDVGGEGGLEAQVAATFGERPVRVVGVVVPLPLGAEDGGGEVVGGLRMLG
jgi:hypothetical protein